MLLRFTAEVTAQSLQWQQQLADSATSLQEIEQSVHHAFARGADLLVAGLVAVVMQSKQFSDDCEQTRQQFSRPLRKGRERTIAVQLLGGLVIWATTLYCGPKPKRFRRDDDPPVGLDITLAQFGFGKGVSPGLEGRVARQVALCPSIAFAHKELHRSGVKLDAKAVKRIAYQCGQGLLALRRHRIKLLRAGKLKAGTQLVGKRVSVQIDGGRMKIRGEMQVKTSQPEPFDADGLQQSDAPGRSKPKAKRTYSSDWREPKLMTIFVHDEQGRMVKKTKATIDGTLLGPDAIAEVVAMHLHRLGAAGALSVTFVADGAPWIWDRIERIVELAGLSKVTIHRVLDCCHAVHRVSQALASLGLSRQERHPLYRELRTKLRNGQWEQVIAVLSEFQSKDQPGAELETELSYLRRHGAAGHLSYVRYRQLGIPCGSGAIESGIRRVINLRLKGNAMSWKSEHAESMLQVRSQVVPDQWDDALLELSEFRRTQASAGWTWEPANMSIKTETSPTLAT